jgi:ABC-type nitrate/sulfonate/bicarbonate transport system permease component
VSLQTRVEPAPLVVVPLDYQRPESLAHRFFLSAPFLGTVSVLALIGLWQAIGSRYAYVVSTPTLVYHAFFKIFVTDMLPAFGRTSQGLVIAFTICLVAGIPLGILIGRSRLAALILEPYAAMLFSLPFVALFPVLILVEGINLKFRVTCIILAGIFPIIINTARGVRLVSADLQDVGRSLVAGRLRTITTIILPGSTRYVFAGIRVGFARAMIGTVVVELEAAGSGVGFIMHRYTEQLVYQNYFAVTIVLGFYALLITNVIAVVEKWSLYPWNRRSSLRRFYDTSPYVGRVTLEQAEVASGKLSFSARVGTLFAPLATVTSRVSRTVSPILRWGWISWLVRLGTLFVLLFLWNVQAHHSSAAVLSTPMAVGKSLWNLLFVNRLLLSPILLSFEVLVVGYLISLLVGIPLGILMGRSRIAERLLDPYVKFLYALPHAVFIPIMVQWLGFQFKFAVAYVFVSAVFPVLINTVSGVKGTDQNLLDTGVSFGASERKIRSSIVIPAAFPMMLTGARLAFSASWVGVIIAEILTTSTGLGGDIQVYSDEFQVPAMYATIVAIMLIAVIILQLSVRLERTLTPWMPRKAIEG